MKMNKDNERIWEAYSTSINRKFLSEAEHLESTSGGASDAEKIINYALFKRMGLERDLETPIKSNIEETVNTLEAGYKKTWSEKDNIKSRVNHSVITSLYTLGGMYTNVKMISKGKNDYGEDLTVPHLGWLKQKIEGFEKQNKGEFSKLLESLGLISLKQGEIKVNIEKFLITFEEVTDILNQLARADRNIRSGEKGPESWSEARKKFEDAVKTYGRNPDDLTKLSILRDLYDEAFPDEDPRKNPYSKRMGSLD